jgi:acyl-coenzyme A thioesterase PaaI-like protein
MSEDPKLKFTRDYQKKIPFVSHLKILTEELGDGTARLSLPVEPHLANSLGTVHGGVIVSLLDVALCTAARTLHPDSLGVITIDLTTGRGARPEGRAQHELRGGGGAQRRRFAGGQGDRHGKSKIEGEIAGRRLL